MSEDLLAAALNYLDIGLAIVPVAGDQPLVPWEQYLTRLPTSTEMHTMFALHSNSVTGIAAVIGPATWAVQPYLCVLRISRADRPKAESWLDTVFPGWELSRIAESGTGAMHVYALASGPVETESHGFITLLGNRCVQLMPPSLVGASGRRIKWISEGQPIRLDLSSILFPRTEGPLPAQAGARGSKPSTSPAPQAASQKRNGQATEPAPAPAATLPTEPPRMTIHARGLLPASGVPASLSGPAPASTATASMPASAPLQAVPEPAHPETPASPSLVAAAAALQKAGLSTRAVIAALSAVNRVESDSHAPLSTIRKLAAAGHQSSPLASSPRQSSPLIAARQSSPLVHPFASANSAAVAIEPVYFAHEAPPPPVEYVVESILTTRLTLLYGEAGATKSLLATALGLSVAAGKPFLGLQAQQLPVAYVDHDLGRQAMHSRVLNVARGLGLRGGVPSDFAYFDATSAPLERMWRSLLVWLGAHPGALIIVDSLEAGAGSKDESAVWRTVNLVRELLDPGAAANKGGALACIVIDHSAHAPNGESTSSLAYGNTRVYNAASSLVHVDVFTSSPTSRSVCITQTKNTFGPPVAPIKYHVVFEPSGDEVAFRAFTSGRTSRDAKSA